MTRDEIIELKNTLYSERMNLQSQLNSDDYKVIKCAEAQVIGEQLPYNMEQLHQVRQEYRARINEIEDELKELDSIVPDDEKSIDELV